MGLDITAYRKLTPAPDAAREDGCMVDWEKHFDAHTASIEFTEENWPGHSAGIQPGMAYSFADKHHFRAGSYGGYGAWRNWLAQVAGWRSAEECWEAPPGQQHAKPFFELIHFADNEGVIGPKVAAKLAKDFADNQKRAEETGDEWEIAQYRHWRKAFEMAADDGAVEFH